MKLLTSKIHSHESTKTGEKQYVREVRASKPTSVYSFRGIVRKVAEISCKNPGLALFYRGQKREHELTSHGTLLYPSIYRKQGDNRPLNRVLKERYSVLYEAEKLLIKTFDESRLDGVSVLRKFREVGWAILQHYEVCETPLLDITNSLRVACSFALRHGSSSGVLYVIGLPHTNGSISYYADEEQINLRLLSICPPVAKRPHFQEGYLVGSWPTDNPFVGRSRFMTRTQFDVARRLVAKFKLVKETFWDSDFHEIPNKALFPDRDKMKDVTDNLRTQLKQWSSDKGFQPTLLTSRG